jgi:acetyl esterase/lipase
VNVKTLPLWPAGEIPRALGDEDADTPTVTIYPPPTGANNGASVVVCPGGGYGGLADHEGKPVAEWLNSLGVTGVVLRYRLGPRYHHPVMLGDAARAIRTVRHHAAEWDVDPARVGVLGFSAGGHLASTVSNHFDDGRPDAADPVERQSSRPDISILIYPVIQLEGRAAHLGSRANLLGDDPDPALIALLSNDRQVTSRTPPTFLVHSSDDVGVPVENSLRYALALEAAGVPFAMQVYEHGGHGYGLGGDDPILSTWPDQCADWMRHRGFLG